MQAHTANILDLLLSSESLDDISRLIDTLEAVGRRISILATSAAEDNSILTHVADMINKCEFSTLLIKFVVSFPAYVDAAARFPDSPDKPSKAIEVIRAHIAECNGDSTVDARLFADAKQVVSFLRRHISAPGPVTQNPSLPASVAILVTEKIPKLQLMLQRFVRMEKTPFNDLLASIRLIVEIDADWAGIRGALEAKGDRRDLFQSVAVAEASIAELVCGWETTQEFYRARSAILRLQIERLGLIRQLVNSS